MKNLPIVFLSLALCACSLFGQLPTSSPFPTPQPVPTVPTQTTAPACTVSLEMYDGSAGGIFRTCELNGVVSITMIGGMLNGGGYIKNFVHASDDSLIILKDDGGIIRNKYGITQGFDGNSQSTAILRANFDQVVTVRSRYGAPPQQFDLYWDDSVTSRTLNSERPFPVACSQVFTSKMYSDGYCVNQSNGQIYQARADQFGHYNPADAQLYLNMQGITFAREYKDGLLILVAAQYECPDQGIRVPDTATFCYMEGDCKQTKAARLLFVRGREKADVQEIKVDIHVSYWSTFTVVGDAIYLVESQYADNGDWKGDVVSKIDLKIGKKTTYISIQDFNKLGIEMPNLWVN